jgi:ganglioside GM2 activator
MEKKVAGFWIKVPCEGKVGSCNYGNLCGDWATVCPKYFTKYGIPCTCPITAGSYSIPDAIVDITKKLPSGASGDFRITGNLISGTAGHLGCVQIEIHIA